MIGLLMVVGLMAPPTAWTPELSKSAQGIPVVRIDVAPCMIPAAELDSVPLAAKDAARCTRVNRASAAARTLKQMRLVEGTYIFRVTNKSVPWTIDFDLKGAHDRGLPKAAGGALKRGQVAEYTVNLKRGIYVFSSPLNGTLEYSLLVEEAPRRRR